MSKTTGYGTCEQRMTTEYPFKHLNINQMERETAQEQAEGGRLNCILRARTGWQPEAKLRRRDKTNL
jgi:hypothetical protein